MLKTQCTDKLFNFVHKAPLARLCISTFIQQWDPVRILQEDAGHDGNAGTSCPCIQLCALVQNETPFFAGLCQ